MKIGILTLPLHTNYGGILQAYALQTVLERMGHEVCVIEKRKLPLSLPLYKMPFCYGKRIVKNLLGHKCLIFYEQKFNQRYNQEQPVIRQYTDKFIKKYIHLKRYENFSDIKETEFDAIVVGSDQVWRPIYFGSNQIEQAYLKFTKNWDIKRIAYAASFGTDEWEYTSEETKKCKRLIQKFDIVSVREDSGVDLCKRYFNKDALHVLDPTMLLCKEDYIKLFEDAHIPKSSGNLLCYILDETEEKKALVKRIAKDRGLIPFNVKSISDEITSPIQERIQPPVEQWLRGFYDAEFVVTDSFHACVFSILFNKPFIVYGNENRGLSRFKSLLNLFDLNDNLLLNMSEYKSQNKFELKNINLILNKNKEIANILFSNLN